jgi:hypothetical protein
MNINGIKIILYKCTFFIVFVFCLFSCNNSNKNSKVIIDSDKTSGTTITQETADDLYIVREPYKAVINSGCEYYYHYFDLADGRLKRGQSVFILGDYSSNNFDIVVEVKVEDTGEKVYVKEKYITYDDELYSAWFKNALLTREYYRTESAEFINAHGSGYNLDKDNEVWSKKDILEMWKYDFSEERLRISEKYLVIGDDETVFAFRLEFVKKDGNKYTLLLSKNAKELYEVTLLDNGNSIVITQCVDKSKNKEHDVRYYMILNFLNYNLVPYDEKKAEETKSKVIAWCDEQIKKLEK